MEISSNINYFKFVYFRISLNKVDNFYEQILE